MFCSQCGRQIPNGSRYCNYCGTAIAVNDMNPDEAPEQTQYQDYSAVDAPKGFETLPYNKHGYDRQTTNSQLPKVPKGGFVQKDYTQKEQALSGQPWQQDFATRPEKNRKKWLLPVIIGILVLLLAVVIVLLLNRNSEAESSGKAYDPSIQANLTNWGYACLIGKDLYTALPDTGLVKIKETDILTLETEPDAEVIKALPMADGETEFTDIMDLVAVGDLLYYQASGSDPDSNETVFRYYAYDTVTGREYELFTLKGKYCYTLDLVKNRLYCCLEGDLFYIDTRISPDKGEAVKADTVLRLGEDTNIAECPEGFLIAQQGSCRGLKLVSFENEILRTYEKVKDQDLYVHLVWNGYAYYRRVNTEDIMTIYRLDLTTGENEVFVSGKVMGDPQMIRMNAYADRIYVGVTNVTDSGTFSYRIMQFSETGELRMETTMPDAPDQELSLLCMVNAGRHMITRLILLPGSPDIHVYTLPDMMKPH